MTRQEQDAFRLIEGGLELLRNAIASGDPHNELELRARDLLKEVRAIAWPNLVAGTDIHAPHHTKGLRYRHPKSAYR